MLVSCSQKPSRLEEALMQAEGNRAELEKVLTHYQNNIEDSLKYRAAVFLIENMPGHYSYKDSFYLNTYYNEIDSVAEVYKYFGNREKGELYRQIITKYDKEQEQIADLRCVRSEYLINNIERSFELWENGRWATHLKFDDFCEYILPYKVVDTQYLDNWREYLLTFCNGDLDKQKHYSTHRNSSYYACETVNWHLREMAHPQLSPETDIPVRRMSTLAKIPFGTCDDYTILALAMMRSRGIPTAMDFTPLWAMRNLGHSWGVLLENTGKTIVFEGGGPVPGTPHKKDHKMAKVFRNTYKINEELWKMHRLEKGIPKAFENYHIKDVTSEYMVTDNVEIALKSSQPTNYLYLAIFDNENWEPIYWAEPLGEKVVFKEMGRGVVYMPVTYINNKAIPFSDPILLTARGEKQQLKADTLTKRTLILRRKFPPLSAMYAIGERMIGGKIEVAKDSLFNDSIITLYTISNYGINTEEIDLSHIDEAYRYWRYYSPNGSYCNIAELFFYEKDSIRPSYGKIIGTKGAHTHNNDKFTKEVAFDGDALTFFDSPHVDGSWVGLDFGKKVNMDRIVYMPRSDGNLIEPGDEYELVYWINDTWKTLGRQIATNVFLKFDNCPSNALFLLHNRTKGKEERIFTYENGEQIWW